MGPASRLGSGTAKRRSALYGKKKWRGRSSAPTIPVLTHLTYLTSVALRHLSPIHDIPKRLEIIGAAILVFEVVGVLPNIAAQNWFAFDSRNRFAHDRIVLVRRGHDFEFAAVGDQPRPAAAETRHAGIFKFLFE